MTRDQKIAELLERLPRRKKGQVVDFLRSLSRSAAAKPKRGLRRSPRVSLADRSFALIPADSAIVQAVLAEDPYDLE